MVEECSGFWEAVQVHSDSHGVSGSEHGLRGLDAMTTMAALMRKLRSSDLSGLSPSVDGGGSTASSSLQISPFEEGSRLEADRDEKHSSPGFDDLSSVVDNDNTCGFTSSEVVAEPTPLLCLGGDGLKKDHTPFLPLLSNDGDEIGHNGLGPMDLQSNGPHSSFRMGAHPGGVKYGLAYVGFCVVNDMAASDFSIIELHVDLRGALSGATTT
ncbi:hypothetical protein Dimus_025065 [Dionaea muscipula]